METIFDIKKNKSIRELKDLKRPTKVGDRLTITNLDYLYYKKSCIFADKIEIEIKEVDKKEYKIFVYANKLFEGYIMNIEIMENDLKLINQDVHIK